jgi:hypothetical protein
MPTRQEKANITVCVIPNLASTQRMCRYYDLAQPQTLANQVANLPKLAQRHGVRRDSTATSRAAHLCGQSNDVSVGGASQFARGSLGFTNIMQYVWCL